VLFLIPQEKTVLGGTMHVARPRGTCDAQPTREEIEQYLAYVRAAIPGFDVRMSNVRRVFAGLLPAAADHSVSLLKTECFYDHGTLGGVHGLYSVAGVKFTTTGDVAQRLLHFTGLVGTRAAIHAHDIALPTSRATPVLIDARQLASDKPGVREALLATAREEAVFTLDDLVLRRTNWVTTEPDIESVRQRVQELIGERNYSCA
jgi:glycerol-3-phosphate dehydrogenase